LADLGSTACFQRELDRGLSLCAEALEAARNADAEWEIAYALYSQGFQRAWRPEHHDVAVAFLIEAERRFRALGDARGLAHTLVTLAGIVRTQGDPTRAVHLARESVDLFWRLRETFGLLSSFVSLAASASRQSHPALAARFLGVCDAFNESLGGAMLPPWQADFDNAVEAARATLGGNAFDEE
jgi:hypothetical protein